VKPLAMVQGIPGVVTLHACVFRATVPMDGGGHVYDMLLVLEDLCGWTPMRMRPTVAARLRSPILACIQRVHDRGVAHNNLGIDVLLYREGGGGFAPPAFRLIGFDDAICTAPGRVWEDIPCVRFFSRHGGQ
jgi:hypothetical protein